MNIISLNFVVLEIVSIFIFYLLNARYRNAYLTILSCGFIGSYNYLLLHYILIYSLINYYIAIRLPDSKNKKALYITGLILNITQLVILKYASFAIDPIFQLLGSNFQISKFSEIIVPIGISYFSLQGIGYLVNINFGREKPEKDFLNFLLFLTFYPKFLSGPIERSSHFLPQLKVKQSFNESQVIEGVRIALIGFFKKAVIANQLAPYVISTYADLNTLDGSYLWILFLLQPLYLYFDFSGYTDIAIGFAKMFGIDLLPNFNRPFFSQNMTNFWKRFHISLSSWFQDYVFRQTNFKLRSWGVYASIFALFVTWSLFGIWHGAGWNFMLLGLLQAIAIIYEYFTKKWRTRIFLKMPDFLRIWVGRFVTYLFYCVSLVFFFAPNLNSVFHYFASLTKFSNSFSLNGISTTPFMLIIYIPVFLFVELIHEDYINTYSIIESFWLGDQKRNRFFRWAVYSLIITILFVVGLKDQQFVYANF
jgi:alginate O-acetyltransferase complex protein AlgI